ncbi:MAG TPA: hypothetical protein VHJ17_14115 [Thermomonospora sp.]|nr:hypothetical protein [Thermomonospora sp.]
MNARDEEIARYAAGVRAALADLPETDRQELVEDLEDHLAEIAAESGEPLAARLGPPESYAAELRAAYGAGSAAGKRGRRLREAAVAAGRLVDDNPALRRGWAYLREFRPAWWLARGYLAAMLVWRFLDGSWTVWPGGLERGLLAAVLVVASGVVGVRHKDRPARARTRTVLAGANAVAVLGLLGLYLGGGPSSPPWESPAAYEPSPSMETAAQFGGGPDGVLNIYPYSKDGKPLKDVLLYDQRGRPVQVPFEDGGWVLDQPCGSPPPISNAYPLPLRQLTEEELSMQDPANPEPTCAPGSPAPAPQPSGAPAPTGDPSPSGGPSPTGDPTPSEDPSPSPSG